ncbi:MAG TPA: cupin domain-containing protein [Atribacter sp.]|uniref:Cupin domain protein n=1 Tax=Candidatus Atribacter allofermentans TaxID=1852833 RepID=A0A1V5SU44_9BACT|nr:cupin domain-containing protein [Atribacter sp.]MDD3714249.1 cupin domain-containing protein [Atribacterota bacterium]OQA58037.1 MAG: Cupin domain protein [Candidatus Atribacteria bacterium ADurb.Bin276]HHT08824.1 cupin domain-containing protein [Candidatus Atribacteria bacterium]MDI9595611.1 cupin domain-containing protein [Atribacterota bacterium]HQK82815.1 cupin domain-containing protein [Atribacter sp.]
MKGKVIKRGQGKIIMEGDECTEIYAFTDKIAFSISTLLPGQRACLDPGHKNADEICYVIQGKIVIHFPDEEEYYLLETGDALLIPPGVSHYSINVGEEKSITAWAGAGPDMEHFITKAES